MMHDTLVHMLGWQSLYVAIVAGAVYTLIKLLNVRDPRILLGLWGLVLLRFFLPLDLAAPWSAREQFHSAATNWVGSQSELRAQAQAGQRSASVTPQQNSAVQDVVTRVWLPGHSAATLAAETAPEPIFSWRRALFLAWLAGVCTLAAIALRQHLQLLALLRRSKPVVSTQIADQIDIWRTRYGITRAVTVVAGDVPMSPFTFGLRRPVVYLPVALLGSLTPAERDAVFGHELAHVRGLDIVWLIIERMVQILFFFHPVAWLATRELARAREGCCDLRAVQAGQMSASHYWSGVLLALRNSHIDAPALAFAPALGPSAQSLKARIQAMKQTQPMTKVKWLASVAGMALLAVLILPMAKSQRLNAHPVPANSVAAPKFLKPLASPKPPAPPAAPQAPEPSAWPAPAVVALDATAAAHIAQARHDGEWQITHATNRLAAAKETARRIAAGDFGNMIVVHNGTEVVCPQGTPRRDVKCSRYFNKQDVVNLRAEASQELAEAQQDLEESRREAAQSVVEAQRDAEQDREEAQRDAEQDREEAQRDAEQAREEAQREAAQAAGDARRAAQNAQRAQRQAMAQLSEARVNAREIEIAALQGTLEGLREAVRDLHQDHARELTRLRQHASSSAIVNTEQVLASVVQSLEASAKQVEQQLAEARSRSR